MPTQILAVGTTAADSADQVVLAGTPLTVCLKDSSGPSVGLAARVDVLLKDDAGQYFLVDVLTSDKPALMIVAPGTYRFSRVPDPNKNGQDSCGVFSG